MKDFLSIPKDKIIYSNEYFFIIEDGFPVSRGHLLIVSNVVRTDYFSLTDEEKYRCVSRNRWRLPLTIFS
ncbi:HIT family protein [Pedobacter nyackensis]|uniref:HIT family protein n=1 Tax=Pedobacter nyackensis TaxID=475255 RepID=UPI00117F4FC1